jgi:hypothetical protein
LERADGQASRALRWYYNELSARSFSPDAKWLATMGFPTGLVRVWPLEGEEKQGGEGLESMRV